MTINRNRTWRAGSVLAAMLLLSACDDAENGNAKAADAPPPPEVTVAKPLIRRLTDLAAKDGVSDGLEDVACLLLDQARIVEGEQIPDPAAFSRRLAVMLEKGLLTGMAA